MTFGSTNWSWNGSAWLMESGNIGPTGPAGPTGATGAASTVPGPQGPAGATGATGSQGPQGATGSQGPAGQGVPTGGTTGQVLAKTTNADYATAWVPSAPAVGLVSIGDVAPASPVDNQLYWSSATGAMAVRFNDGNSTQWVQVNTPAGAFVPVTGGTMTGDLTIRNAAWPALWIDTVGAAAGASIYLTRDNKQRWVIRSESDAETGSNAGSTFKIYRCNDAGAALDSPLTINRATGAATFVGEVLASTFFSSTAANVILSAAGGGGIYLRPNGPNNATGQFTIDQNGNVSLAGDASALEFSPKDSVYGGFRCKAGGTGVLGVNRYNFNWVGALQGWVDNTGLGNVSFTSDYRIKKDVLDLPGTWDIVKALRPIKYTQAEYTPAIEIERTKDAQEPMFAADDKERWGFIAHELQETLIEDAATGVKDDPTLVQSPNPWTMLAALTKALQEAMARIEALEAR
ncbi:MAG: tail fiber domain-containing protein [Vicinamibacterales bacterium]